MGRLFTMDETWVHIFKFKTIEQFGGAASSIASTREVVPGDATGIISIVNQKKKENKN